jgi:hypothetical protein
MKRGLWSGQLLSRMWREKARRPRPGGVDGVEGGDGGLEHQRGDSGGS